MALNDLQIRQLKAVDKPKKLFDDDGLFLLCTPAGGKLWRFKFRFAGKEKLLSLGKYPALSLSEARKKRDEARDMINRGIDPAAAKTEAKQAEKKLAISSFKAVSEEWLELNQGKWKPNYAEDLRRRLEYNIYPYLADRIIGEIEPPELLGVLRTIQDRGAIETAHKMKQTVGQIFRYAIVTDRATRDPSADLRGALASVKAKHLASLTDPREVGALLSIIADLILYQNHQLESLPPVTDEKSSSSFSSERRRLKRVV